MRIALAIAALVALPAVAAQAQHAPASGEKAHASNHAAAFGGLTIHDDAFFTLGAEYTRRQPEWKSFGGTAWAELIFAGEVEFLFGASVNYFLDHIVFETGPGLVVGHGTEFLWRIGAGYELKSGGLSITPKALVDFIGGTTFLVLGVAVGKGF